LLLAFGGTALQAQVLKEYPVPAGSHPHDVAPAPDVWYTAQNAVVRVEAATGAITRFPLPAGSPAVNMNTAAFDSRGTLWLTGQAGYYGSVEPESGRVRLFDAPRGRGPYGIAAAPDGFVYYVSLAAGHLGRIDPASGQVRVLEPPGLGGLPGHALVHGGLPGQRPQPYAVYVDERDPRSARFESVKLSSGDVRQLLGRPGELWGAESGADRLVVIRF